MMNSNRERKLILLVEDEEDAREIATLSLKEYTLICARGLGDGLRLARQRYFDIYIIDKPVCVCVASLFWLIRASSSQAQSGRMWV